MFFSSSVPEQLCQTVFLTNTSVLILHITPLPDRFKSNNLSQGQQHALHFKALLNLTSANDPAFFSCYLFSLSPSSSCHQCEVPRMQHLWPWELVNMQNLRRHPAQLRRLCTLMSSWECSREHSFEKPGSCSFWPPSCLHAFAYTVPSVWNTIPSSLHLGQSLFIFGGLVSWAFTFFLIPGYDTSLN